LIEMLTILLFSSSIFSNEFLISISLK